jgi:hypothetical protein
MIMSDNILNTLLAAGFLPNYDKSIFTPVQSIDWLGFTWNLKDGVLDNMFVPRQNSMKMPEIVDDLDEYIYDDIRTLGRILQHNCLVLRTAWLRLRPKIYLLFFNVVIHMPKVQNKPFFSGIGNCYCKRVYHVRNVNTCNLNLEGSEQVE